VNTSQTRRIVLFPLVTVVAFGVGAGCPPFTPPEEEEDTGFMNTTDKTNANAKFISSVACRQCHTDISNWQLIHGHAHKLTRVQGGPPSFPEQGTRAGVPNPPQGFEWSDISYVVGGYTKKGRFIDHDGYVLVDGVAGVKTQWNLDYPANGTTAGFASYEPERTAPKAYDYSCFVCHTTGPLPQDEDFPEFQENRRGFVGTWVEAGIQCEACHGPGSAHFSTQGSEVVIDRSRIFVDPTSGQTCQQCHSRPFNDQTGVILAKGGFIQHHEQWPELRASGGHASFACTVCHDPHRSVTYDRANAIRNECTACHADMTMAGHGGETFVRGDYQEALRCESCHMPLVTKSATSTTIAFADGDQVGTGRIGDTRTHIFRISTDAIDYTQFFTADGGQVRRDEQGRAAVTVDFVCLRCHNAQGNVFGLSVERAAEIAGRIHELP